MRVELGCVRPSSRAHARDRGHGGGELRDGGAGYRRGGHSEDPREQGDPRSEVGEGGSGGLMAGSTWCSSSAAMGSLSMATERGRERWLGRERETRERATGRQRPGLSGGALRRPPGGTHEAAGRTMGGGAPGSLPIQIRIEAAGRGSSEAARANLGPGPAARGLGRAAAKWGAGRMRGSARLAGAAAGHSWCAKWQRRRWFGGSGAAKWRRGGGPARIMRGKEGEGQNGRGDVYL